MLTILAAAVLFVTVCSAAQAQTTKPNLGLVMWSAFSCATYADLSKNEPEQKRLFNIGYAESSWKVSRARRFRNPSSAKRRLASSFGLVVGASTS
jgi:hypothetical protein